MPTRGGSFPGIEPPSGTIVRVSAIFLHEVPYHLHDGITWLQAASWTAIVVVGITLVATWGRIIAWLQEDEAAQPPRVHAIGRDDGGWYAELRHAPRGLAWRAELPGGEVVQPTVTRSGRSTWLRLPGTTAPLRLLSDADDMIELAPGATEV